MTERPGVALFVDYEYAVLTSLNHWKTPIDPKRIVEKAMSVGAIEHAVAFGDFNSEPLRREAPKLRTASIDAVSAPTSSVAGKVKSYTDFVMLDNIYQTLLDRPEIGTFLLVTGDGHFSGVVARLRVRHGKTVGVLGIEGNISGELKAAASFVAELEPLEMDMSDPVLDEIIRFIARSQEERRAITFGATAQCCAASLNVPEEHVRQYMAALSAEGAIIQSVVEYQGRPSRVMRLSPTHPRVRQALGPGRGEE
ncbi:MAG: NYN domain-containing protein [Bacillota bacterium]|jgi:uncharacterized LabA/DUF88 family protein